MDAPERVSCKVSLKELLLIVLERLDTRLVLVQHRYRLTSLLTRWT
jgi:hypothetical protein